MYDNAPEFESDKELLVQDLILLRQRSTRCIDYIAEGKNIDASEEAKKIQGLIYVILFELGNGDPNE